MAGGIKALVEPSDSTRDGLVKFVNKNNPKYQVHQETIALSVTENQYLQDIIRQFLETRTGDHPIPLWCFYETKPSPVGKTLKSSKAEDYEIVPRNSACLDPTKGLESHPLERNHYHLQKFSSPSENGYRVVRNAIAVLASGAREYLAERSKTTKGFHTRFSLQNVPQVRESVDRPPEMGQLEHALRQSTTRRKIFVSHGLGGIGKPQLAFEFRRQHKHSSSSIFWLDGSSEDAVKTGLATCASRIPAGQISDESRLYSSSSTSAEKDINKVVAEVRGWLSERANSSWLIVFDNVDREYDLDTPDPRAYDVWQSLPDADRRSILITTRLAKLTQIGTSMRLNKVDRAQAKAIFQVWYSGVLDPTYSGRLFDLLDGLPLGIAQAGAYLQQTGDGLRTYIDDYEWQWSKLMQMGDQVKQPLPDYFASIRTTWNISYINSFEIRIHLRLTYFSYGPSLTIEIYGDLATNRLDFLQSMRLLRNHSLVESMGEASCATHPVVHSWRRYRKGQKEKNELARLATMIACSPWATDELGGRRGDIVEVEVLNAVHGVGILYAEQGMLGEAREMYERALQGLGNLYTDLGRLDEADNMCQRTLQGYENALGADDATRYKLALNSRWCLGVVYWMTGDLTQYLVQYLPTSTNF